MGSVQNVRLQFQISGSDSVTGPNQYVYLDVTQGTMSALRTNAQGVITAAGGRAVTLEDSRDYRIVTADAAINPAPPAAQGAVVRVRSGMITVAPHIRIQVTSSTGGGQGSMPCVLGVGTATSNVTTNARGWIWSNDRSAGEVTLSHRPSRREDTKLLKTSGGADPQANLSVAPAPLNRGSQGTITIRAPANAVGFRLAKWEFRISHVNPGLGSVTATVARPETEAPSTWDQRWEGVMCASGAVTAKFCVGVKVRATGAAAVSTTVIAADPVEANLNVAVAARTGTSWQSTLTQASEQPFTRAIGSYADLGEHAWNSSATTLQTSSVINSGPNKGCQYVSGATAQFTSTPRINQALSNTGSAFAQAQGKAYLQQPTPVRVIPSHLYTVVGPEGRIQINNQTAFQSWAGQAAQYRWSNECIGAADLLTGTRRHEHNHPNGRSHKENCLKAYRALEPVVFAEQLVKLPGATLDFRQTYQSRIQLVINVGTTHDIVDEAQTRQNNSLQYVAGQSIPDVNADANGTRIAPVWNPSANNYL
jgi:hypothetical protein